MRLVKVKLVSITGASPGVALGILNLNSVVSMIPQFHKGEVYISIQAVTGATYLCANEFIPLEEANLNDYLLEMTQAETEIHKEWWNKVKGR